MPLLLGLGVRRLDKVPDAALALRQPRPVSSPKAFLQPARERVAVYSLAATGEAEAGAVCEPHVLLGLRGCDLKAIEYLDKVFLEGEFRDPFYAARRRAQTVITVDCAEAHETCFCTALGGKPFAEAGFDLNLTPIAGGYLVDAGTDKGRAVLERAGDAVSPATGAQMAEREAVRRRTIEVIEKQTRARRVTEKIQAALLAAEKSGRGLEASGECVECAACTFICPTCYCFYLYDQATGNQAFERLRAWDSCVLGDYSRTAGPPGAKPSPRPRLRSRFANRLLHKYAFGPSPFGLLGNRGCPVQIRKGGPDRYLPDYLPHAGYAGLCGRGSLLAELLDHHDRLLDASRRVDGGCQTIDLNTAMQEVSAALRADGAAAIIVDGNLDLDTLAAAGRLAAGLGASWSVYVPPNDAGLVHGLDAGGGAFIGPEDLAATDAILIIGNAYATHPVAAHWVFEARKSRPRMPVFVMADASGVTADFATGVFQPLLGSGEAARAIAAVRTGQTEPLGPDARALAAWKERLRGGKSIAIVVGAELDYADARALGTEVARLGAELGAKVCPLTTYGGAWGAVRLAAAAGAAPLEKVLAGAPRTLMVMGVDLDSSLGQSAAGPALGKVGRLIYAGPMLNRTSRRASLVLPAAFPFESGGRALLRPGREVRLGPLLRPPAGVPTVREILAALGAAGEAPADVSAAVTVAAGADGGQPKDGSPDGLLVAPAQDPFHFADGSLTRSAAWPQVVRPRPVLAMAESDARAAGLVDKGRAVVEGPGGAVEVEVAVGSTQRPGQARVSAAFAEVRDMFGWTWGGRRPGAPVRTRVRKA